MQGEDNNNIPIEATAFRYRIVYDALARLSCNINKCGDVTDIINCLNNDIKYLFDYYLIRLTVKGPSYLKSLSIGKDIADNVLLWESGEHCMLPFEELASANDTPRALTTKEEIIKDLAGCYSLEVAENTDYIWIWPFRFSDDYILTASIFSGGNKLFKRSDIPVLKILCESFFAKIRSLQLYEEVIVTKTALERTNEVLEEKNNKITELVNEQEQIIELRTRQLQERNQKLSEIVTFNAHNIREPLTRITGLLEISKISTPDEIVNDLVPLLQVSSGDLDKAIKNVITFIENND